MTDLSIHSIVDDFKKGLNLNGLNSVFEFNKELTSEDLIYKAKPEEYTKIRLIRPILELLECDLDDAERIFEGPRKLKREVDYTFTSKAGLRYILEAKPLNADLFADNPQGGVNQVLDALKLHDVVKEFDFGIASDGFRWVFINSDRKIVANLDVNENLDTLRKIFHGDIRPDFDKEEVSKKFYRWYSALLYGGKYENHEGKTRSIARKDSLVESIQNVTEETDRERIAQTVMDRLIFIKFLESKGIIKTSVIKYMQSLPDNAVNPELKSLFFQVMNTDPSNRGPVTKAFKDIPYLNGSLFIRNQSESKFTAFSDYWIGVPILREVFRFLDSFTFTNRASDSMESLDPEILGYIFEMSMVSRDRKGTGAFYTPREITMYMSREAIHSCFVSKVREYLRTVGYPEPDVELIKTIDDVYKLSDIRLADIFGNVLGHIRVCDNACGSGAFLLAAADVLFDIYYTVNAKSGLSNSEVAMKKLILAHNIFGVDLNANAVEIAKLRMWLWVVDSYKPGYVEALPNIDYNVLAGDSLIGYVSIKDKLSTTISLDDYGADESTVEDLLREKESLIAKYRSQSGNEARTLKVRIDNINRRISGKLSMAVYGAHADDVKCSSMEFFALTPFHWGFEFSEVFEEGGFDVIVGNPPYIHLEDLKESLARQFYEHSSFKTFKSKGDVYQLFYERSNELLKNGGILSYITSNSWMKAKYGTETRKFFVRSTEPLFIIDLADLKIFKSATVEANIFSYQKNCEKMDREQIVLPSCILSDNGALSNIHDFFIQNKVDSIFKYDDVWNVSDETVDGIMNSIKKNSQPLKNMGIQIRYGIKFGTKDAFLIHEDVKNKLISQDPKSEELIMPILSGRDLQRFSFKLSDNYVILVGYDYHDRIINSYPAIYNHLLKYETVLKSRGQCKGKKKDGCDYPGQHHWLELDNNPGEEYIATFNQNKIAWIDLSDKGRFALVPRGIALSDTAFFFTCDDSYYLLGILNSNVVTWYFGNICATSGAGTNRWKKQYVEQIPIPVNPSNKSVIESLVAKMMENPDDFKTAGLLDLEVCKAYGLSQEEIDYILQSE